MIISFFIKSLFFVVFQRKHPDILSKYEEDKVKQGISGKRQKLLNIEQTSSKLKQNKLDFKSQSQKIAQKRLDDNIINYVVQSMKPLSTVDDPNFVKIFTDISENFHVMSRRTLGRKIEMSQKEITEKLINILSNLDFVSTTADIWSTKTRSFLGVTAHWVRFYYFIFLL